MDHDQCMRPEHDGLTKVEVVEFYQRHGQFILQRCRQILRDEELALTALQRVFVAAKRDGITLSPAKSILDCLYELADRCSGELLSQRLREPAAASASRIAGGPSDDERSILVALLRRVEPGERMLALLLFGDGLTEEEIAVRLGWYRNTLRRDRALLPSFVTTDK
jgi:RNA polymerase sigma-70 factor (ECF subfamily)